MNNFQDTTTLSTALTATRQPMILSLPDDADTLSTKGAALIMSIGDMPGQKMVSPRAAKILNNSQIADFPNKTNNVAENIANPDGATLPFYLWKFGFRSTTARKFETQSLGTRLQRISSRVWESHSTIIEGYFMALGIHRAAMLASNWVATNILGAKLKQTDLPTETITYASGPSSPMTVSDYDETPYIYECGESLSVTTPMSRAFAAMDVVIADLGLPATNKYSPPNQDIEQRQTSR